MKSKNLLLLILFPILMPACSSKKNKAVANITKVGNSPLEQLSASLDRKNALSLQEVKDAKHALLVLETDKPALSALDKDLVLTIQTKIADLLSLQEQTVVDESEKFLSEGKLMASFYGLKGDSISLHFTADNNINKISLVEERSGRVITQSKNKEFNYTFTVQRSNAFSVIVESITPVYYDLVVNRKPRDLASKFTVCELIRDSIPLSSKTPKSITAKRLVYKSVFNEPKKFVVAASSSFSGESKIYAPIDVPQKTIEFLYKLTISGDNTENGNTGGLFEEVDKTYHEYKLFGKTIWESSGTSTSLTREILNALTKPDIDEKYTLNVFFFDKEKEIKKFLNYSGDDYRSAFAYDLKNSALSTESRNGLIKKPASGYSYIGLQTNSTFTSTYVWLDVVALYEETYFYEIKTSLKIH